MAFIQKSLNMLAAVLDRIMKKYGVPIGAPQCLGIVSFALV
jgi:hypothetical protein